MPQENKEYYTPGPWKAVGDGNITAECLIAGGSLAFVKRNANVRLVVEAPNMFALLKEYLEQHTGLDGDFHCPCYQCKEARRIIARVLGED